MLVNGYEIKAGADLRGVDLRRADLRGVDLSDADLRGADLDYSCWPLWCGSKDIKVDKRIFTQLLAHICCLKVEDGECVEMIKKMLPLALHSHIAREIL